jgi:hypothetical protein
MSTARIYRFVFLLWVTVTCPFYAIIAVSFVAGLVATACGISPVWITHHSGHPDLLLAEGAVALGIITGVGCYVGRGVYRQDSASMRFARLLLAIGMGYDLLWIVLGLVNFTNHPSTITTHYLLYLAKFVCLLITNYLCFKQLIWMAAKNFANSANLEIP